MSFHVPTGGTTYNSAYSSLNYASGGTIDLGNSGDCNTEDKNGSDVNVCGGTQTFHVPKPSATDMAATASYYRYRIPSGGASISSVASTAP